MFIQINAKSFDNVQYSLFVKIPEETTNLPILQHNKKNMYKQLIINSLLMGETKNNSFKIKIRKGGQFLILFNILF